MSLQEESNSEIAERLTSEVDDLRALKNSRGYALFLADVRETRQGLLEDLIRTSPADTGHIGRLQGAIKAYDIMLGENDEDAIVLQMIDLRLTDIEELKPDSHA